MRLRELASFENSSRNLIGLVTSTGEMIGFACYFNGEPSKTVKRITRKLKMKNYKYVARMLNSNNNAERYMAVIVLEKLAELNEYYLTESNKKHITEVKQSTELVSVCSGCTYFDKVELKKMFESELLLLAQNWLNYNFKKE